VLSAEGRRKKLVKVRHAFNQVKCKNGTLLKNATVFVRAFSSVYAVLRDSVVDVEKVCFTVLVKFNAFSYE